MSPEVLSIIGILLGLAILIVFALKGVSLYVLAPLAALVVAIFAGGNTQGGQPVYLPPHCPGLCKPYRDRTMRH